MKHNILHVVNIYFVIPYFIGKQFIHFRDKGHNLHVICSPSEYLAEYAKANQFAYKEIPVLRSISPIQDFKSIIQICKYIHKHHIDTLIGHTPKGGLLAMVAGFIMRVPNRIYFRHGLVYETSKGFKKVVLVSIERLTSLLAHKIVCVSPSLYKKSLKDKLNRKNKQIVLGKGTCGGIDTQMKFNPYNIDQNKLKCLRSQLRLPEDAFVIGYCGRLVRDKGIQELVKAFDNLLNNNPSKNLYLLLVGMFEERDSLSKDIVIRIKTNSKIIFTGFINENIELYYSLMNIFILPSYREGFGMCVLEASAMKCPILTTKVTGCIDSIVEGETGIYIENTTDSIEKGIEFFFDPMKRKEFGENARNFAVQNFDNIVIWKEIEKLYQ